MKLPKINLRELEKQKEQNFKERLKFIGRYAEYIRKNTNKKWSSEQKNLIDSQVQNSKKFQE